MYKISYSYSTSIYHKTILPLKPALPLYFCLLHCHAFVFKDIDFLFSLNDEEFPRLGVVAPQKVHQITTIL